MRVGNYKAEILPGSIWDDFRTIKLTKMDYILEDVKTGVKLVITLEQKQLLDELADIEYSPVDTKIYKINKNSFYLNVIR